MAEAKRRHDWSIGSTLVATLINVQGGIDGRAVTADECNPCMISAAEATEERIAFEVGEARLMWGAQHG